MHYENDVPLEQLIMPLKLKHKIERYVRYVNIVIVVLFTNNAIPSEHLSLFREKNSP